VVAHEPSCAAHPPILDGEVGTKTAKRANITVSGTTVGAAREVKKMPSQTTVTRSTKRSHIRAILTWPRRVTCKDRLGRPFRLTSAGPGRGAGPLLFVWGGVTG
jgi:hypothetical protein